MALDVKAILATGKYDYAEAHRGLDKPCKTWNGPASKKGKSPLIATRTWDKKTKFVSLHRLVWIRHHDGQEPYGVLATKCGNPLCIEPEHLCYKTALKTHCRNGHALTPDNTRWRLRRARGEAMPTRECLTCWKKQKRGRGLGKVTETEKRK